MGKVFHIFLKLLLSGIQLFYIFLLLAKSKSDRNNPADTIFEKNGDKASKIWVRDVEYPFGQFLMVK